MTRDRKELETFGRKRKRDYVRVLRETVDGRPMIRVQWREPKLRTESFEDTRNGLREAKAFAEGTHERLKAPVSTRIDFPAITYRQLWEAYWTAKLDSWREATQKNKRARWAKFELFVGKDEDARRLTRERLDEFKRAMMANGHSTYQVAQHIQVVTALYRWAVDDRDLLPPTKVTTYVPEFSRDAKRQVATMEEYQAADREKILAQLDPRSPVQWRAWALATLFAYCAPRQNAARHLEWRDIDFTAGVIHWRAELDKMGTERWQPMPPQVIDAFRVAYGWRCFDEYTGPFVFYGVQRRTRGQPLRRRDTHHAKTRTTLEGVTVGEKPYTYAAFHAQHAAAESRAGIAHKKYRSSHGHRRGVATDIHAATGSTRAAADWIGDKSTRVVDRHYVKTRTEELRRYAGVVVDAMTKKEEGQ